MDLGQLRLGSLGGYQIGVVGWGDYIQHYKSKLTRARFEVTDGREKRERWDDSNSGYYAYVKLT